MNRNEVLQIIGDFAIWCEVEADEAHHDCGNPDGGNPLDCDKCRWAKSARQIEEVLEWLTDSLADVPSVPEPEWNNAPEWAQAHYYNAHGYGCWSDTTDIEVTDEFYGGWKATKQVMHLIDYSGLKLEHGIDWRTTLNQRPGEEV